MIFNSIGFAFFFLVVFIAYHSRVLHKPRHRNLFLLAASYLFYGCWDWRFLGLIFFTTVTTYFSGLWLTRHKSVTIAALNIAISIAILVIFKYFNFFSENLVRLMSLFGWNIDWVFVDILLPVGISFYTFQAIGYTVDAYRGELKGLPTNDFIMFATFIAYFPQLVAGPIERASNMLPQFARPTEWNYQECVAGLRRVLWGLMKKVVVADQCGLVVDRIWANGIESYTDSVKLFFAALLFTVQIYCDFSGYCDIALGTSRMLGIKLSENFTLPYFQKSVIAFWRHWHISLMDWFKNYVYIPLGGSRKGQLRRFANIAIVFLLSGLWHGASWNFVVWGVYWAAVYIAAVAMGVSSYKYEFQPRSFCPARTLGVLAFVVIGFTIFRCNTLGECVIYLSKSVVPLTIVSYLLMTALCMIIRKTRVGVRGISIACALLFALFAIASPVHAATYYFLVFAAMVFLMEWADRSSKDSVYPLPKRRFLRYALYLILYIAVITAPTTDSNFIYFQF